MRPWHRTTQGKTDCMKDRENGYMGKISGAFRLLGRYQPMYYAYMVPLILVTSAIPLTGVWLPKVIIEFLTGGKEYGQILAMVGLYVAILILMNVARNFLACRADLSIARFRARLQLEIGRAAMNAPISEIENARYREEIILAGSVAELSDIMNILQNLFSAAVTILGLGYLIVRVNLLFFLLAGFTLGLKIVLSLVKFRGDEGLRKEEAENNKVGGYLDYLQYYDEGAAKEVRADNAQDWLFGKISAFRDRMVSIQLRSFRRYNLFEALQMLAVAVQNLLILFTLSGYYMEGRLSIADFSLYFSSVTLLSSTLSGVTDQMFSFSRKLLYCSDFNKIVGQGMGVAENDAAPGLEEDKDMDVVFPFEERGDKSVAMKKRSAGMGDMTMAESDSAAEKGIGFRSGETGDKDVGVTKRTENMTMAESDKAADIATVESIVFENVSFSYPETGVEVLHNVSFRLHRGDRAMLVGPNGSGKTTFIKLLCRFYQPDSGRICMDGIDISTIPEKRYYALIATVFQDFSLFSFPVSENVSLKESGLEDTARLWSCLEKTELDELVKGLKEKERTHISRLFSEDGVELSGGEKQRLGIARAVYKDARILVLDEPAASLDVKMEEELYRNFYSMTRGKISLTVSHRLSQATVCNKIFVLDQGTICEEGTHGELMEKDGIYAAMFRKQREAYVL